MSFDSGPLDRYLHSAVGDDPALAAELHATFVASVEHLLDLLQRSRCDANWTMAALRLKSLAATFGVVPLIQLAEQAMAGVPGDPAIMRDIRALINDLNINQFDS
ncbi:MAG: Hpt domain-containing protein [Sphingopyxis sp.]|nr:Hpt domain-containing protein [Sphingopyxis sp.]